MIKQIFDSDTQIAEGNSMGTADSEFVVLLVFQQDLPVVPFQFISLSLLSQF